MFSVTTITHVHPNKDKVDGGDLFPVFLELTYSLTKSLFSTPKDTYTIMRMEGTLQSHHEKKIL